MYTMTTDLTEDVIEINNTRKTTMINEQLKTSGWRSRTSGNMFYFN